MNSMLRTGVTGFVVGFLGTCLVAMTPPHHNIITQHSNTHAKADLLTDSAMWNLLCPPQNTWPFGNQYEGPGGRPLTNKAVCYAI